MISPGSASLRSAFTLAPLSSLVVFAVFAALFDVLGLLRGEEAAWYLFEELVGYLLCAVAERFEGQDGHVSTNAYTRTRTRVAGSRQ